MPFEMRYFVSRLALSGMKRAHSKLGNLNKIPFSRTRNLCFLPNNDQKDTSFILKFANPFRNTGIVSQAFYPRKRRVQPFCPRIVFRISSANASILFEIPAARIASPGSFAV